MVKLPDIIHRLVKISIYAKMVSKGGTYHPVYIQLSFRVWIPRTLRVGKVGIKVSFTQPLGARLVLQDLAYLAMGPVVKQVKTKIWMSF